MSSLLFARRFAVSLFASLLALSCAAQGYPGGGGMGKGEGRMRGKRSEQRTDGAAKPGEPVLRPGVMAQLASALEKESPSMALSPAAAAAMQDLVRELKDFAALDDGHVRERMGWSRGVVHAEVDLQRDLREAEDSAHELAGAAADVLARWKRLADQLDASQRERVLGIYAGLRRDTVTPPSAKP